eukprot:15459040-Alexandrium_andersonii.AAC.3
MGSTLPTSAKPRNQAMAFASGPRAPGRRRGMLRAARATPTLLSLATLADRTTPLPEITCSVLAPGHRRFGLPGFPASAAPGSGALARANGVRGAHGNTRAELGPR